MSTTVDSALIDGKARTIREMMQSRRYGLDFYQREYTWKEANVVELLNDLSDAFLQEYEPQHERVKVASYRPYFLGTVVTSIRDGVRFLVDGQQRITTLSLLLMHLNALSAKRTGAEDLSPLVYSERFGVKSFNLDVGERNTVMTCVLNGTDYDPTTGDESSQNIWKRYTNIADLFPADIADEPLLHFIDWLLERVMLVEIVATDEDMAVEIFETMNDRGLQLTSADMLKSFLVARVGEPDTIRSTNRLWRDRMEDLKLLDSNADSEFLKVWLRSKYANTIRERKKDAVPGDFDKIGSAFHKWVRDNKDDLGLHKPSDYDRFVNTEFEVLSRRFQTLVQATETLNDTIPAVFYNAHNGLTLQFLPIMAAVTVVDDETTFLDKARLISDYLDLMIARRMVNYRNFGYSTMTYALFIFAKDLRDKELDQVRQVLADRVAALDEGFDSMSRYRLNQRNRSHIAYLLARITSWIEGEHGPGFVEYVSRDRKNRFEVEHIWANKPERHTDEFDDPRDFADTRDLLGDLLLLPKDFNASYNDATYAEKVKHYPTQNLLAKSLTPIAYSHNPTFTRLIAEHHLPFKAYPDQFTSEAINERQALYQALCELIWSPDRLGLGGGRPPISSEARKRHYCIALSDVLANSSLEPGPLISVNRAWPVQATLNPDGTISVNDRSFTSPSGASDHVTGGSTNGWDFWGTTHDDTTTTLSQFRDEAIKRLEGHEN
ncbi:MAG: DUF262 domain-containing protein [Candidatus Nanopelagicales bacterium]